MSQTPPPSGSLFSPPPPPATKQGGLEAFKFIEPGRCTSCGAPVLWAKSIHTGKLQILDPPVNGWLIDEEGEGVTNRKVFLSHFGSCPNAKQHRKPR